eukprot:175175-Chlamydomonas_euryale.AAC.4
MRMLLEHEAGHAYWAWSTRNWGVEHAKLGRGNAELGLGTQSRGGTCTVVVGIVGVGSAQSGCQQDYFHGMVVDANAARASGSQICAWNG